MRLHTRQDFCCWRTLVASECSAPRRQNSWHATSTTGSKGWQKSRRHANPAISDRTVNQLLERFRAKACPGLDPGLIPVRVRKTRQNNNLGPRSDSIGTEKAPGAAGAGKAPNRAASVFQYDAPDYLSGAQFLDPFLHVAHRLLPHRRRLDLAAAGERHQFLTLGQCSD